MLSPFAPYSFSFVWLRGKVVLDKHEAGCDVLEGFGGSTVMSGKPCAESALLGLFIAKDALKENVIYS